MIDFFSPAKVNLSLRILDKREDGFHELSSLFQTIDFGDRIQISPAKQDCFTLDSLQIPCDNSNLIMKALYLFRHKTAISNRYHIHLQKKIPIEAGLGGGSSNAATTLWALNSLNGSPATTKELMSWSAELGSDVPFFFSLGTAHCTGRGELVQNLEPTPLKKPLWLIKPPEGLSTKEIYNSLDLSKCSKEDRLFSNDLESAAFIAMPSLKELKKKLDHLYDRVVMSGSGTSFICEGEHPSGRPISLLNRRDGEWFSST